MPEYTDSTGTKLGLEINLQDAKAFIKVENDFLIQQPFQIVPGEYTIKYKVESN